MMKFESKFPTRYFITLAIYWYLVNLLLLVGGEKWDKAQIIDGKAIAESIQDNLKKSIEEWAQKGNKRPHLAGILLGDDPSSKVYIRSYTRAGDKIGIKTSTEYLHGNISEAELLKHIDMLNKDDDVDGILILLPLPKHISEANVWNKIDPHKDVEGLNKENLGKLYQGVDTFVPCSALAIVELIRRTGIETVSKNAVVLGRSKFKALPAALILQSDKNSPLSGFGTSVTICHEDTPEQELEEYVRKADILVAAMGVPNLVRRDFVKPGSCVIDSSFNVITDKNGKEIYVGDVDFEGVSEVAGLITPVPGGVGPMIVTMLMENTFKAARNNAVRDNTGYCSP